MASTLLPDTAMQEQLVERRARVQAALRATGPRSELQTLLDQVDAALARVADGSFGLCLGCHDPIEEDRLASDPVVGYCIDCLTPDQRRALEDDLERAATIQATLLPPRALTALGWDINYSYRPAGPVSGDFCDVVPVEDSALHVFLGDVSGKGLSASLLVSHLHAILRGLVRSSCDLVELMACASRLFVESTPPSQYATLVGAILGRNGEVELVNAGHVPPLLVSKNEVRPLSVDGLPVGMFASGSYSAQRLRLAPGETLLLATDGLVEGENREGEEYGLDRVARSLTGRGDASAEELTQACLDGLAAFRAGTANGDDLTVMAVRRVG